MPTGRPRDEPGRDGDVRIAGDGRGRRAAADVVIAVDQIGHPGRPAGRRDERVEPVLRHHRVDARACARAGRRRAARGRTPARSAAPCASARWKSSWPNQRHLALAVLLVERDQILQRPRPDARRQRREVFVQAVLELEQQHLELGIVELALRSADSPDRRCTAPARLRASSACSMTRSTSSWKPK